MDSHADCKLVVIGAGLPRTGTSSMRIALEVLLGGHCYHMRCCITQPDRELHIKFWNNLSNGSVSLQPQSFHRFFRNRNFCAGVDVPIVHYYKALLEAYPDAKVVLTVREPESWYQSVHDTLVMYRDFYCFPYSWIYWLSGGSHWLAMLESVCSQILDVCSKEDSTDAVQYFSDWLGEVKRVVPREQLLIYSVKEGWGPLCKFLDVPVPAAEFPKANERAEEQRRFKEFKIGTWFVTVSLGVMIGLLANDFLHLHRS